MNRRCGPDPGNLSGVTSSLGGCQVPLQIGDRVLELTGQILGVGPSLRIGVTPLDVLGLTDRILDDAYAAFDVTHDAAGDPPGPLPGVLNGARGLLCGLGIFDRQERFGLGHQCFPGLEVLDELGVDGLVPSAAGVVEDSLSGPEVGSQGAVLLAGDTPGLPPLSQQVMVLHGDASPVGGGLHPLDVLDERSLSGSHLCLLDA